MNRLAIALTLLALTAAPAYADAAPQPDWVPNRNAGGALPDEKPADPAGWRLAAEVSSPYSLGVGLGYLLPLKVFTLKGGVDWGIMNDTGVTALKFQDWRLYGGLMYYFLPGANDGPYVETGLDVAHSHGGVLNLVNWPVVPHLGFGTVLRAGSVITDVNFSATANGLLALSAGVLFGAPAAEDTGTTKPWEPYPAQ